MFKKLSSFPLVYNNSITVSTTTLSSQVLAKFIKTIILCVIIVVAIFGNSLVIISVLRFNKLRKVITNRFVVSLALADLLVSSCVMTFSATMVGLDGLWLFGSFLCDLFNANDVLFSTASIAHLASISMDRYISIKMPFQYNQIMTNKNSIFMLLGCWIYALVVSYIPIFTGIYSNPQNLEWQKSNPTKCEFRVNPYFGIGSSIISFWIPCIVMTTVYGLIYKDARKQENQIFQMKQRTFNHTHRSSLNRDLNSILHNNRKQQIFKEERLLLQKEHKAAKTLGIIMGGFIVCWLPFFLWMTIKNVCLTCPELHPILVDTLFWIGYFNSTLNPIIYAFYQQDFRRAFKIQLKSCCCIFQRFSLCLNVDRNSLVNSYDYYGNSTFSRRKPNITINSS